MKQNQGEGISMKKVTNAILGCSMTALFIGVSHAENQSRAFNQVTAYARANAQAVLAAIPAADEPAVVPVAVSEKPNTSSKAARRLATLKNLLKGIPAQDRAEFLNGLIMEDGHLVTPDVAPLKRTMEDKQIFAILQSLKPTESVKLNTAKLPIRIADALKDVPEEVRDEFIENLTFKGDAIVSYSIVGLRKLMDDDTAIDAMVRPLLQLNGTTPAHDSKMLCGDGVCFEAACYGDYHHNSCHDWPGQRCVAPC